MFRVIEEDCTAIFKKQEIAAEIRKQIGINVLMACGARDWQFLEYAKGLRFKVNHGRKRQFIDVVWTPSDTYTVKHMRLNRLNEVESLGHVTDVYCEQLSETVCKMVNI